MRRLFGDYPEALANAAAVAERCAGVVALSGAVHMPRHPAAGQDGREELLELTVAGARRRYRGTDGPRRRRSKRRLRRELSCIEALGFAPYFLLAHEAARRSRSRRASPSRAGGAPRTALVSYCLGLTQPEPFSNRLLFERFLHEGRRDPPDIDLDFCSEQAGRGARRDDPALRAAMGSAVAATAATLSLRGAVRVAARALGHPPGRSTSSRATSPPALPTATGSTPASPAGRRLSREPAMRGHPLQDTEKHRLLLELSAGLAGRIKAAGHPPRGPGLREGGAPPLGAGAAGALGQGGSPALPVRQGRPGVGGAAEAGPAGPAGCTPRCTRPGSWPRGGWAGRWTPTIPPPGDKETYALIRTGRNAGMFQLESPGQMHLTDAPRAEEVLRTSWPRSRSSGRAR